MSKVVLIFILIFAVSNSYPQQPSSVINPDSLNTNLLELLIKTKIDSVRKKHDKKILIVNDTLKKSAQDQAMYIKKIKKLSHFQKNNPKKKTPANRAAFYGLKNTGIAENVIYTYVLTIIKNKNSKEYINSTYADVAGDLVTGWVNSPEHYANLINAEYSLTGVAVSFDKATKRIYAVQVFSSEK